MILFTTLTLLVLGYFWSGIAIASLHRYAHKAKVSQCRQHGPRSAAIYQAYHLAHHHEIRGKVATCYRKLSAREWVDKLRWAVDFALTNSRWMALRTLYVGTSMAMFAVLIIGMLIGLCSLPMALCGSGAFLAGAFMCLLAYDLCHSWTHGGGPFPSALHSAHHAKTGENFGMWQWHNWVNSTTTWCTIWMLRCAEWVSCLIPPLRRRLERALLEVINT